ncbi:MAG: 3-hydroxyacyl-CoA dehydrogenase NAD-binding domain-containing protein [Pseudomonadota bacterium]
MSDPVTLEVVASTALITVDNPPVNAASAAVRQGLVACVDGANADPTVEVIAVIGAGRTFTAGADIREFGKPPIEPMLGAVCSHLEASEKPVVAVVHGTTLGGGLEIALGCHARVGLPGVQLGFPEVSLGIIPGAGGTQRAPRLSGLEKAAEYIASGRRLGTDEAVALGLLDDVQDGDPRTVALASAEAVRSGALATRRIRDIAVEDNAAAIDAARAAVAKRAPLLVAPQKCVDAVAAATLPLEDGLRRERELFAECMATDQHRGLVHAFFAERAVQKIPEATETPRDIATLGVVGGGTMGSGIATAALFAGLPVTLVEMDEAGLDRARGAILSNLDGAVKRGKLSESKREAIVEHALTLSTALDDLADVDLVIEAVFEDMDVKKDLFAKLDMLCKPDALLASNTSYLDINVIAAQTGRPSQVLGLHFFSPAHIMRLLEVVVGEKTAPDVVATGFALGKRLRKVAVRAGVCDGFIGNRILGHFRKVADYLMLDGAHYSQIDTALEQFGFAMGPFAVSDLAGLDIGWATRKRLAASRPAAERDVGVADRICEQGWFGRKTQRGFYDYRSGTKTAHPEVDAMLDAERAAAGITPVAFADDEIVDRYMTAMISEAVRVVEDGIALRPVDVDTVFLFGYGFPRQRGGPLHYADTLGAAELVSRIERWAEDDPHYWQVPELLRSMATSGGRFADLNTA